MMETFANRRSMWRQLKQLRRGSILAPAAHVQLLLVPVLLQSWLTLLLGALIFLKFSQANAQQPGFVSLACGASKSFLSNSIDWMPDDAYAPPGGQVSTNVSNQLGTLRFFPDTTDLSTRICYSLPIPQSPSYLGQMILVRATFDYLNYDGLNQPPIFYVALGATNVSRVNLTTTGNEPWVVEVIYNSTQTQALCLLRQMGNPVISSLEVRPLINASYVAARTTTTTMLRNIYRINCGASNTLRYPDDPSDRIWSSDQSYFSPLTASAINASASKISALNVSDQAPLAVLSSARVNDQNESLTYTLPLPQDNILFSDTLIFNSYFTELSYNYTASLKLSVENHLVFPQISLPPFTAFEYTEPSQVPLFTLWNLTLQPVYGAPLINGLEVFSQITMSSSSTSNTDVGTLHEIQSQWNLSLDWVKNSDPCYPVPWKAIICDRGQVISLDLSNMGISGPISFLWNFQNLHTLNLSNNSLAGTVNLFGDLTTLTQLDVSNNHLSGQLTVLTSLNSLVYLNVMNNNFVGPVPPHFLNSGFTFLDSGNPCINSSNGNCQSPPATSSNTPVSSTSSTSIGAIVGGAVGGVAVVVILLLLFFIWRRLRQQKKKPVLVSQNSKIGVPIIKDRDVEIGNNVELRNRTAVKAFSLKELDLATNHFRDLIGKGSFGPVFFGRLTDGNEVAIKRRADTSKMGTDAFLNEVNLLSRVHHPNLVELVGYYTGNEKKNPVQMLVYEYMSGGTLTDHLYGKIAAERPLDWRDRLSLAVGAASGIEYLHNGSDPKIIHRDVKSSNILISSRNEAKVSDFGLSKLIVDLDKSHFTTAVKGTAGYLDPEYFNSQQLTEKSDVYSFGVVLLEILFAREPLSSNYEPEAYNLTAWARPFLQQNVPKGDYSIVDRSLLNGFNPRSLEIVSSLALRCTENYGMKRPVMAEVLRELRRALAVEDGSSSEMPFKESSGMTEGMPFSEIAPR